MLKQFLADSMTLGTAQAIGAAVFAIDAEESQARKSERTRLKRRNKGGIAVLCRRSILKLQIHRSGNIGRPIPVCAGVQVIEYSKIGLEVGMVITNLPSVLVSLAGFGSGFADLPGFRLTGPAFQTRWSPSFTVRLLLWRFFGVRSTALRLGRRHASNYRTTIRPA